MNFQVKDLPGEIWKTIEDAPLYMISNKGRIKSKAHERFVMTGRGNKLFFYPETIIKPNRSKKDNYCRVGLLNVYGNHITKTVHRLMGIYFIPNPDPERFTDVCHKNGKGWDNRLANLEWNTHKNNCNEKKHCKRIGKKVKSSLYGNQRRAKPVICDGITFSSAKKCAEYYGVRHQTMVSYLNGNVTMPKAYKQMGLAYIS